VPAIVIPLDEEEALISQPSMIPGSAGVPVPAVTPFAAVKSELFWIKIEECVWGGDAATGLGETGDSRDPSSKTATIPHRLVMIMVP
jgi:hypothetical protein